MERMITCFERVLYLIKPMQEDKKEAAVEIIREYNFSEFLDYCVDCGCFTKEQSTILYAGIVMWEGYEENYSEEDYDKLMDLYNAVGIYEETFNKYGEE